MQGISSVGADVQTGKTISQKSGHFDVFIFYRRQKGRRSVRLFYKNQGFIGAQHFFRLVRVARAYHGKKGRARHPGTRNQRTHPQQGKQKKFSHKVSVIYFIPISKGKKAARPFRSVPPKNCSVLFIQTREKRSILFNLAGQEPPLHFFGNRRHKRLQPHRHFAQAGHQF